MTETVSSRLDLFLHPVRLRILVALGPLERTTRELAASLDDIPVSSLYRHVQALLDAGVLEVVSERRVRGAVEKTLRVRRDLAPLTADEQSAVTPDRLRQAFLAFMLQLYQEFDRYLAQPNPDMARDLVGFTTVQFYASDEEWLGVAQALNTALAPLLSHAPGEGRRRRRLATVALLDRSEASEPPEGSEPSGG